MENQINMAKGSLEPLTKETAAEISGWEYEAPYEAYNFKGHQDEYLLDESIWGVEQFCLTCDGILLGQVACQYEGDDLWVGWSMRRRLQDGVSALRLWNVVSGKSAE